MSIQSLSFRQLALKFVALGQHKQIELMRFAGVTRDVVEGWAGGWARPDIPTERHVRHYLVTSLEAAQRDTSKEDELGQLSLEASTKKVTAAEAAWDSHLDSLRASNDPSVDRVEKDKARAISLLKKKLGLA